MDELQFDGDVVAITGSGRGLGRAYALDLARRGARVVVNDLGGARGGGGGSEEPARETVETIRAAGGEAVAHFGDISTAEGGATLIEAALSEFGRIDALVNNAGIAGDIPFADATADDFERYFRVHVLGSVHPAHAAWPHFVRQGHGRIVNTTSGAALYGMAGQTPYASAKGAILGFTRSLSLEGESHGIRVNAIGPAGFTRMQDDVVTDEAAREFAQKTMRSEFVAPMIAILAHRTCPTTGQIFEAFSGRFARVITGEEAGYMTSEPTAEAVRDNWDTVVGSAGGLLVPGGAMEAAQLFIPAAQRANELG